MEFVAGLRCGAPEKIRVRFRVIADDVAAGDRFAEKFWMLAGKLSDDEERGACSVPVEEIEKLWRHRRIRAVVKGNSKLARRICMSDCGTENFRVGVAAGVGEKACASGHGGGYDREVRIHADIFA